MKNVVGGLIAIILGVFCITLFFPDFLNFMAGIIPLFLILGGGLVIYLKYGEEAETTDDWNNNDTIDVSSPTVPPKTEPVETEAVETEPVETEPVETAEGTPADNSPGLLGNTGSLVFHTPDCQFSKSKKCTAVFSTREEAIQEGYKPCGACKP
jgi:hypothetical protein